MDWLAQIAGLIGAGGLGSLATAVLNGWKEKKKVAAKDISLDDALKHSRHRWRDYAYSLSGVLKKNGIEVPPEPDDPYSEALKELER